MPPTSDTTLDIGALPFVEGGYLLVRSALAKLGLHAKLTVIAHDEFFATHCESYCKSHGIAFSKIHPHTFLLEKITVEPGHEATGKSPGAVSDEAQQSWGLAARGAAVEAGVTGYHFPLNKKANLWSEKAGRYYRLAASRQWNPESIDWNIASEHSEAVEDAVVQVMTYLIENETAALIIPSRFVGQIHPHYREVAQFLAVQAADEARHIEVFTRRATLNRSLLGVSSLSGQRSLQTLIEETDFSLSALLLSVLGEGTFLTLLLFLSRYAPDALTRRICRLAARDESRHVAFAMSHLMSHASDTVYLAKYRTAIELRYKSLASFSALNEDVYASLHLVMSGSVTPADLRRGHARMVSMTTEMHRSRTARLTQLGFSPGEAAELSSLHTKNFM